MTHVKDLAELRRTDPFASGANLSLEAYPWLQQQSEPTFEDDKFAPLDTRGQGAGSSGLKKFLGNPDRESVVELRDLELLRKYDEQHGSGTTVYANGVPFQISQRGDKWHAKGKTPDGTVHRFSASSRDALFPRISRAVEENAVKELTPSQRLEVVRVAQAGNVGAAIVRYLEFAIGEKRAARYASPNQMLGDPTLADIFDEAASVTWFAARPKARDSEEFQEFLQEYRGNRPLNHDLLDGAYESFTERSHRLIYAPLQETQQTKPESLDNLSDQEVERLLAKTAPGFVLAAQQAPRTYQKFPAAPADGGSLDQLDVAVAGRA